MTSATIEHLVTAGIIRLGENGEIILEGQFSSLKYAIPHMIQADSTYTINTLIDTNVFTVAQLIQEFSSMADIELLMTSSYGSTTYTQLIDLGFPGYATLSAEINHAGFFRFNKWTQVGDDIDGEDAADYSGYSVSLSSDGSVVAIGAPYNDGAGGNAGHVRIYQNVSGTWTKVGDDIDGKNVNDISGYSVSLSSDGSVVAIGAKDNGSAGFHAGHVRIYQNVSGTWTKVGDDIDGEDWFNNSGRSVSLSSDGSVVAIGATGNDGSGSNAGHVRIYQNVSGTWTKVGDDIDGEAANDSSGWSVSLSSDGSVVAIGGAI